jgi:alpha-1,2-mannosyltransferase
MAFSFPVARFIGGCKVGCYVHYPTISTDMLAAVASRKTAHNNASAIASSPLRSAIKLIYYRMFAAAYAMVGRRASVIMANSSWTAGHVEAIWGSEGIARVYPPCNTVGFQALPLALQVPVFLAPVTSCGMASRSYRGCDDCRRATVRRV